MRDFIGVLLSPVIKPAFLLAALLLVLPGRLLAQTDLSLWGYIRDSESGQPIAGASVRLLPGGESAVSNQEGLYSLYNVRTRQLSAEFSAEAYLTQSKAHLTINSEQPLRLDIYLEKRVFVDRDQVVWGTCGIETAQKIIISSDSPGFSSAKNLGELLKYIPGVIVQAAGGANQTAAVSIGGAPANQTGIFIDGVAQNSHLNGEFDLNSIPREAIQGVEIYTAGAGGLLGVGPLAGAVNIITRKAALKGRITAEQQAGSLNSRQTGVSLQNTLHENLSGLLIFNRNTASNDFQYLDPKAGESRRGNNYRDLDCRYLSLHYRMPESHSFYLTFSEFSAHSGLPGALYALTPEACKIESFRRWLLGGTLAFSRKLGVDIGLQHHLAHQHFVDSASFYAYNSKYRDRQINLNISPRYYPHTDHLLSARISLDVERFYQESLLDEEPGLAVYEERLQSGINYDGRMALRNIPAVFDYLNLNLAFTQTVSKLFDPLISPLVSIGLEKGERQKLMLDVSYGNSYRAPTYASLFWSEDAFSVGNPGLRPEKSEDFRLGAHLILSWGGRWDLGAEYQHSYVTDMIFWERRFDGKYMPFNLSAARTGGLCWNISWDLAQNCGRVAWSYLLADPRDRSWAPNVHDRLLTFHPRKMSDLLISFTPGKFYLTLQSRWVSERQIRRANTKHLAAYTVSDLSAGLMQKIGQFDFSIHGRIENIFSEKYQIIELYPLPGRCYSLALGITYNFSTGGENEN